MAANTSPIFSLLPEVSADGATAFAATLTTATGDYTGASANHKLVFTAGSNGGYIAKLRFKAAGTNSGTAARIYINNGSTNTTAANNTFYGEASLPSVVATNNASTVEVDYPMGFAINAGFRIYVGIASNSTGWVCTAVGGKY